MSVCDVAPGVGRRPADIHLTGPPGSRDEWPLVGRAEPLDRFRAAQADPRRGAFFVTGLAGVGKTRLALECLAIAASEGLTVGRVAADVAAALSVAPRTALTTTAAAPTGLSGPSLWSHQVARTRPGGRQILFVDDLDRLDARSLASLRQFVDRPDVFLLATMCADGPPPDLARRRSAGDRAIWIDLADLERDAVDTLLPLALDGPVTADTAAALWEVSQGNPSILRETVAGALERGHLVATDGVWRLRRAPTPTARLRELFAARLSALDSDALAVLEHLALGEPVGVVTLSAVAPMAVLERLERRGMINVTEDGRRRPVRLSNPLYGEMIRERLPRLAAERMRRERLRWIREVGARRRDDTVSSALWQLDTAGTADADLLRRAAWLRRDAHDFAGVERLARAALDAGVERRVEMAGLLGDALSQLGRTAEADQVLAAAAGRDGGRLTVGLSARRAFNLSWGALHSERALAVLAEATSDPSALDDASAAELNAATAAVLTLAGRPRDALELLVRPRGASRTGTPATPERDGSDPLPAPTRPLEAFAQVTALAALGRTTAALTAADVTPPSAARAELAGSGDGRDGSGSDLGELLPDLHPAFHTYARATALYRAGRLDESVAETRRGLDAAVTRNHVRAHSGFAGLLGRVHLAAGRPRTAIRWLRETVAVAHERGLTEHLELAYSGLALAHAYLGDESAGRAALDRVGPGGAAYRDGLAAQASAWNQVLAGDTTAAVGRLSAAADEVAGAGELVVAAALLHDMARLGSGGDALARLRRLAAATDSAAVTAAHAFTLGTVRRDADRLAAAATAFESLGAHLYAAEAVAEARRCHPEERGRNALGARVAALEARCEGARTPPLLGIDAVPALSIREREICGLAARGLSGAEIAGRLVLSVRTVNNHLQKAYRKLGITRRSQLPAALRSSAGGNRAC